MTMTTTARGPNEALIGLPGSRHALGTPALVLDVDALDANIASMARHASTNGYSLRANAKVHKSVEIARRQIAAGAIGVACATLAEAEAMTDGGITGVLLFTPVVAEAKLARLAELNARASDLIVLTDDPSSVSQLADTARRSGSPLKVLVDVYVGGRRTGMSDPDRIVDLARSVADAAGLEYAGVHAYVGGLKKTGEFADRRAVTLELLQPLLEILDSLRAAGLDPAIVSGGGTASHDIDHELGVFTESNAGSYALMDVYYADCAMRRDEPHPFRQALSVRATVTSAAHGSFVITDVGYKEIDALGGLMPVIMSGAPRTASYSIVGDDMGRIDFVRPEERLNVGDVVELQPPHCYQTPSMYSHYHVVRGDTLVDIWPVDARSTW